MIRKLKFLLKIAAGLFVLMLLLAAAALLFPQRFLCVDSGAVKADAIVVLGGGSHERPECAAELFKQHAVPRIIVSGYGDCEINRRALIDLGVPASAIEMENQSRTTQENAQFTIKMLRAEKARRVIIVTSWYHSRRALACFRHYASEIKFYSRPSYYDFKRADWSRSFAKRIYLEYLKLPGYWIRYGICPL